MSKNIRDFLSKYNDDIDISNIKGKSITLGAFDGCHLGHKELLNIADFVISFWPLPKLVFNSDVKYLNTLDEKKKLSKKFIFLEFTKSFASQSAESFLEFIQNSFEPKKIIIGWDFGFGKNLEGSFMDIEKFIQKNKLAVEIVVIPPVLVEAEIAKSTLIREFLSQGHIIKANAMLGYDYFCIAKVVRGKGIGKKLGFPTINLDVDINKQLPKPGVYIGKALLSDNSEYVSAISLLDKHGKLELEAFLISFPEKDLYEQNIKLSFISFLRDSKDFSDFSSLQKQIKKDVVYITEQYKIF
jgi:riboflavin kinase / FMN adenylyltransferase